MKNRIRIGIDVGGTFTKAVAIDVRTGKILAKSIVPTTHTAKKGVSEGILDVLKNTIERSNIDVNDIELISHSTTQAINALLESDTATVGIIAMGVEPEKKNVINRTNLRDAKINAEQDIKSCHTFLDTSHLISEDEVKNAIKQLQSQGAKAIVATESFGVDDSSNEEFVMKNASELNILSTASHEISGTYGLEIRTLTAAINASVLPKTFQVAKFVEDAIHSSQINAPLMIMKGDGGVTNMSTFKTKPILTILSGPAASVAGALLYLKITNGIFVEVGGTSTNISTIKNGKPEFKYVTIKNHPTCIRSMDVRVLGVAGGSMVMMRDHKVWKVGPRSAHIAGLKYSCFADPKELETGKIVMIKPRETDVDKYVAIQCKNATYAITNTCAANALGLVEKDDYSFANPESAKIALQILARETDATSFAEVAQSIINNASFEIIKTISKIIKEFKLDEKNIQIIGAGGGASVLVPFVAKQLQLQYSKAKHADIISSIGVASSMLQEEIEQSMHSPTSEQINNVHKKIHSVMVEKGAVPESIVIDSQYISEKSILRVTALGNVDLDSTETSKSVFTLEELKERASEIIQVSKDAVDLAFESDHYVAFIGRITKKRLFSKKNHNTILVLDRFGKMKKSINNGRILQGNYSILKELDEYLKQRHNDIAPQIYLINNLKLVDYSGLTSASHILDAVKTEFDENERLAIIIEN